MATVTMSVINDFLKNQYAPSMQETLNNENALYQRLEKSADDIKVEGNGLNIYIPVYHKRPAGHGWRNEGGTLPTARAPGYSQMKTSVAYVYGSINISRPALKAASSQSYSFSKGLDAQVNAMNDTIKHDIATAFWSDGSGSMGQITQASGSIVAGNTITVGDVSMLEEGMRIDSYDALSGGTQGLNSVIIDQVDFANNTITLTATATVKDNDYIFLEDSYSYFSMGIKGIVDGKDSSGNRLVSTFQNITRSTNLWADANVLDNAGTTRSISVALVQQGFERGEVRRGKAPTAIYSNYGVRRAYVDLLSADKRFMDRHLDGGFDSLSYTGGSRSVPWLVDRFAPKNQVFFLHEPDLQIHQVGNGVEWVGEDGSILSRGSDDSFDARACAYLTLASKGNCGSHSVLRDITE